MVGSCVSRPYAVLPPRSILELFVPLNRFCDRPEEMFGGELNLRNILVFADFWSCVRTENFFFCDVLDLRKCLLVKKK